MPHSLRLQATDNNPETPQLQPRPVLENNTELFGTGYALAIGCNGAVAVLGDRDTDTSDVGGSNDIRSGRKGKLSESP